MSSRGLERVGRLTARRFIGGHDWYREGVEFLVREQDQLAGFWKGATVEADPNIATSFALLFLSKGRRPVLISKLQRPGEDWQQLRHDVSHLTSYTERRWKMPLTWQVIDSRVASAADYAQTPVLFISGKESFEMDEAQVAALREYVEQGGFIFADACCSGGGFDRSFRKLMKRVFPERQLALKSLDPEQPPIKVVMK